MLDKNCLSKPAYAAKKLSDKPGGDNSAVAPLENVMWSFCSFVMMADKNVRLYSFIDFYIIKL